MTPEEADKAQRWAGMDGATAFHIIDRHADGWDDVGMMMDAWRRANQKTFSEAEDEFNAQQEKNGGMPYGTYGGYD